MTLTDFARKVLESDSLESKFAAPDSDLTDESPGPPAPTPSSPGRPVELRLRSDRQRASFPGIKELESNEEQRGILLHFFANHELLATELMALVLLKFPEAPTAFRRGILTTLKEEQRHTRWYLERMRECGVHFGDFPVSGYFWDAVAPMETPLDYVTRLSLTFEQANLDYARHYADLFKSVGDTKTAKILDRVYHDEIGHVGYGLKWFRRWKAEGDSDWEAFQKRLIFPLSPSRAKATGSALFNAEGRLAAGFDAAFVNRLEIFERSKGRTPNVYCFFPDEEAAMASSLDATGYHARDEIAALASDLEILPAFLASRDDVVLVKTAPSENHRRRLRDAGLPLPEFETIAADGSLATDSLTKQRKLHELRPWGWGPRSARLLDPLKTGLPECTRPPADCWNATVRSVYSKAWDVALLEKLATRGAVSPSVIGRVCASPGEVDAAVREIAARGFENAFLKAPFGASGQKNQRIAVDWTPDDPLRRWAARTIEEQGSLIVEPFLDRVFDFSVQYHRDESGIKMLGVVRLENDARGQFVAARCGPKPAQNLDPRLAQFLAKDVFPQYESDGAVASLLDAELRKCAIEGPVGVDALVYRLPGSDQLLLKPVVEINPRFTMGRVALELMRRIGHGHWIAFEIVGKEALNGYDDEDPGPIILNDPSTARRVLAVLHIAKKQRDLPC